MATWVSTPARDTVTPARSAMGFKNSRDSPATASTAARSSGWGMATDSSSDSLSTSLISSTSRSTSTPIMVINRLWSSGSFTMPEESISVKPLMLVRGVLSSCETLAANSERTVWSFSPSWLSSSRLSSRGCAVLTASLRASSRVRTRATAAAARKPATPWNTRAFTEEMGMETRPMLPSVKRRAS